MHSINDSETVKQKWEAYRRVALRKICEHDIEEFRTAFFVGASAAIDSVHSLNFPSNKIPRRREKQ